MTHRIVEKGMKVLYIPTHLLSRDSSEMIKEENLGVVTSKNDKYIFVQFKDKDNSVAVKAQHLYTLKYRDDLANLI